MSRQPQQTDDKIHEDQLLNFLTNSLDEEAALSFAENAELDAEDICEVLIGTCTGGISIPTLCERSENTPHEDSVLYHLHTKFDLEMLEQVGNTLPQEDILNVLPQQVEVCADLHLRPYYGGEDDTDDPYHSQAKRGTTVFHAYATLYARVKNKRYTLAIRRLEDGDTASGILAESLGILDGLSLGVKAVYLDREFYDSKCLTLPQAHSHTYAMPIVRWGRTVKWELSKGWSRVIQHNLTAKLDSHSWAVEFPVHIDCTYQNGRYNERGVARYGCAADAPFVSSPRGARYYYAKCFDIGASYRFSKQNIAATSTQDPVVRLLYVVVSLLLQSVWRYLHWEYVATSRRGGRRLWERSFKEFISMVRRAAWTTFATRQAVLADRSPDNRFHRQLPTGLANDGSDDVVASAAAAADSDGSPPIRP